MRTLSITREANIFPREQPVYNQRHTLTPAFLAARVSWRGAAYAGGAMKQSAFIRRLARATGVTPAVAADRLDHLVANIVGRLRRGQSAAIPGFGAFPAGNKAQFDFTKSRKSGKVPL